MMNNSENCVLRSNSIKIEVNHPAAVATIARPDDVTPPSKQSSLGKLINRLNKSQSNLKSSHEMTAVKPKIVEYKRSFSNADQTELQISLDSNNNTNGDDDDEHREEKKDVCSSLLNMQNHQADAVSQPAANTTRSTSMSRLPTAKRRSSISSLFESSTSLTSQLDLNIFATLQNRQERRRSTGHLTSKNLLNQIKNMNSMDPNNEATGLESTQLFEDYRIAEEKTGEFALLKSQ